MAGRPKIVRSIKSYINYVDNHSDSGPMKMGTAPSVGITRNYWHNLQCYANQTAGKPKKSYKNMVFLGINPAQTPVREGFTQSCNYNYSYVPNRVQGNYFADYNKKYHNHFYRPYLPNETRYEVKDDARLLEIKQKYTDAYNSYLNRKYIGMNR
jgi:predicted nucleic acid binding AN1-type Zn finger protein